MFEPLWKIIVDIFLKMIQHFQRFRMAESIIRHHLDFQMIIFYEMVVVACSWVVEVGNQNTTVSNSFLYTIPIILKKDISLQVILQSWHRIFDWFFLRNCQHGTASMPSWCPEENLGAVIKGKEKIEALLANKGL